ncbi:MAG: glycosyltransferase family 2 protein [Verrucomicrobiota bacterium]|nr:glycosyltransferase family 2 protein [Verrucomicrobiota bacterium]
MKLLRRLFTSRAERQRALAKEISRTKKRYAWWFDHPLDWTRPVGTLYLTGWCLTQEGKRARDIRARIGRRKFPGNYQTERKDVANERGPATETCCGFAIAVPLPSGHSEIVIEVRGADSVWLPIASHQVTGAPNDNTPPPQDAKYFIPNPGANPRIDFWLDRPSVWSKKFRYLRITGWCLATSGDEINGVQAQIRKKVFRARYGTIRPDIALLHDNIPGALRSGFSLDVKIPPGRSDLVLQARSGEGRWETFFTHSMRGPYLREEFDEGRELVGDYALWIKHYDTLRKNDLRNIRELIAEFRDKPLISVLLPVYNSNPKWLRAAIRSVQTQIYPQWELCIADDASTDPRIWPLLERYARRDSRIRIMRRTENGHISATSNDALALATGKFFALLDHDDTLAPTALFLAAHAMHENPKLQLLYSDEDKLDAQGRRADPYFKTDWNPELLLAQNYISHLGIYRTALVRSLGGFWLGFEGSQDHDLTLRVTEKIKPEEIKHLPYVLYHWRTTEESTASEATAKPYAQQAAQRAVQEHLDRRGLAAEVISHHGNYLRTKYALPAVRPLVSIVIPTRNRRSLLESCVEGLFARTDYENYELIVLDNESDEADALDYLENLRGDERVRVERIEGEFNYSRLNNCGAALARGTILALLNNDVEPKNASWLGEMVSYAVRPEIGMVGARLWYPNGPMQHGGVILGAGGIAGHAHVGVRFESGYFARPHLAQNLSAVTAACALTRREVYEQMGGLDEVNLAVAFNDVDYCLRLRKAGYWIVWTPHAELIHHESASRGFDDSTSKQVRFLAETDYMNAKWGETLRADPFYNPNLSLEDADFTLAFPPRVAKPWRKK